MEQSIVEAVAGHARRAPERPAILFEGATLSYGQLYADAERFARALLASGLAAGLAPGERVALYLENCPEFAVGYLGAHLAGGVVTLVNSAYRQVELGHIFADSEARVCVTSQVGMVELASLDLPALRLIVVVGAEDMAKGGAAGAAGRVGYEAFLRRGEGTAELRMPTGDAPASIGYTSGTTGRSKGALLLHRNHVANTTAITTAWRWSPDDRLLLALPLFHGHGLGVGLHSSLFMGSSVALRRKFDASEILAAIAADPLVSVFFGVPTMYARLIAAAIQESAPTRSLRLYVSGSAPLPSLLFDQFERLFGQRILERYGMTETGMNLTNPYEGERRAGTVGAPFPGQQARIVETSGRFPLPPGVVGEIEVRGPHVFAGYLNRPDATAAAFDADGWFRTGDLGWVSDDGYYTITGRAHDMIISGGYNIYPREIEEELAQHPAVAEVAVLGLPDADLGERVVAVIAPRPDATPDAEEIIAWLRERLASFKKPRQVIFVESLPRNAMGKVMKHTLRDQALGALGPDA